MAGMGNDLVRAARKGACITQFVTLGRACCGDIRSRFREIMSPQRPGVVFAGQLAPCDNGLALTWRERDSSNG